MTPTTTAVRIKGNVLKGRLGLVRELGGEDGLARVLARLPEADQLELRALLPAKWYPFDLGERLDQAVVEELGRGRPEFFEQIGRASADHNLGPGGLHRDFMVVGDPHAFLQRTRTIYRFYYDQGRREYERVGDNEAVLTTYDAETFSAPDCLTVVGWHCRALELVGARNPRVVEEECRAKGGKVCRYRVSWT